MSAGLTKHSSLLLHVAGEIQGTKHNLEVMCLYRPTVPDLTSYLQTVFRSETFSVTSNNSSQSLFTASKVKLYDDATGTWVDLISETQLSHKAQLYVFSDSTDADAQGPIPPPRKPIAHVIPFGASAITSPSREAFSPPRTAPADQTYGSPARSYGGSTGGSPAPKPSIIDVTARIQSDPVRTVFDDLDQNGDGVIELAELYDALSAINVDLSLQALRGVFQSADINRDGRISPSEFERFAILYPVMIESLYKKAIAKAHVRRAERSLSAEREAAIAAHRTAHHLSSKLRDDDATAARLRERTQQLRNTLQQKKSQLADIAGRVEDGEANMSRLTREKGSWEMALNTLHAKSSEAQRSADMSSETLRQRQETAVATSEQLRQATNTVERLREQLQEAEGLLLRARDADARATIELEDAKARMKHDTAASSDSAAQTTEMRASVESAVERMKTDSHRLASLQRQKAELESDVAAIADQLESQEHELDVCTQRLRAEKDAYTLASMESVEKEKRARELEIEASQAVRLARDVSSADTEKIHREVRLRQEHDILMQHQEALRKSPYRYTPRY